ncbi:hypothetical protein Dda_3064 [Drechslerella dactyloides]|uniref:G-protein coupled receptors family 2 profile 2 domain-containing protein n=1 Tax=Drechslerella dactyloides TaxID=74499 RepID=A0AAD6J0M3_DREDA|nr:hypothetical protein Dda_3064 [Drechslerella dactyloides]
MSHTLTPSEIGSIEAVQRTSSVLSILGALFIIVTFLASRRFHKPINRLAFYAAIANILSTVATTIARAGPASGQGSGLCNMQGLFIQSFLPSDALFIAFMALNVYLTVNFKYSTSQLKKLEPYYVAFSFGMPLLSGLILLWVRSPGKGPIYGDATLWCWISEEYDVLRLAIFYAPVWLIIFITFVLYILAGKTVFKMRNDLRRFDEKIHSGSPAHPSSSPTELSSCALGGGKSTGTAIQLTTVTQIDQADEPLDGDYEGRKIDPYQYTVTIQAGGAGRKSSIGGDIEPDIDHEIDHEIDLEESTPAEYDDREEIVSRGRSEYSVESTAASSEFTKKPSMATDSTVAITAPPIRAVPVVSGRRAGLAANRRTMKANAAAWAYTRCAFLFFIGLIITWFPSSLNRVYGIIHPTDQQFGLYITASLVLPAQGLWNFVIYVTTSWGSCKLMWRDISIHFAWGGVSFLRKKPSLESLSGDRKATTTNAGHSPKINPRF